MGKYYLFITALFLGFVISLQAKSYESVEEEYLRDVQSNIFQEIKILKDKNKSLRQEISDLERNLEDFSDKNLALQAVESQINRYTKLSGRHSVFGAGITVTIDGDISTPWVVDLVNAFFNSGAEAVSVNGIRLVNRTIGFDTLPRGQILLNGSILSSPYVFNVIGEPSDMISILELPGGIFSRLSGANPDLIISTEQKEVIQMN